MPETHFALNLSIARGLDYYTGTVYETTLNEHPQIGSICSGGRYENLAGHYTKIETARRRHLDRRDAAVLPAARGRNLSAPDAARCKVLVAQMDEAELPRYLALATELRDAGINTEVVMEPGKLARQFKYADRAGIRFVSCSGRTRIAKGSGRDQGSAKAGAIRRCA